MLMLDEVPECVSQTGGNEVGGVSEEDGGLFASFGVTEGSLMRRKGKPCPCLVNWRKMLEGGV